jgi:preprotein translocase subunit SecE
MFNYFKESLYELRHNVTWPTPAELNQTTIIVIVSSIFLGLMIWLMDLVWAFIFDALY